MIATQEWVKNLLKKLHKSGYIGNEVGASNLTTYNTGETVIGTWIDGKPIYRRIFNEIYVTDAAPNAWYYPLSEDAGGLGVDTLVNISAVVYTNKSASGIKLIAPYYDGNFIRLQISGDRIYMFTSLKNWYYTIMIEYTKRTD